MLTESIGRNYQHWIGIADTSQKFIRLGEKVSGISNDFFVFFCFLFVRCMCSECQTTSSCKHVLVPPTTYQVGFDERLGLLLLRAELAAVCKRTSVRRWRTFNSGSCFFSLTMIYTILAARVRRSRPVFIKATLGVYQHQFAIMKRGSAPRSCVTIILMRLMVQLCLP